VRLSENRRESMSRRAKSGEITKECENADFSRLARSGFSSSPECCRVVSTAAAAGGQFQNLPRKFQRGLLEWAA